MIRYALACDNGHDFESWFPSGASYDAQSARGLVACPICDSAKVDKRLMAPALGRKDSGAKATGSPAAETPGGGEVRPPAPPAGAPPMALLSERDIAIRTMLKAVREHVTQNSDYVGRTFADEARRMHHGEIAHRSIYGETDRDEARALIEDGIEIHPLPIMPDDRN